MSGAYGVKCTHRGASPGDDDDGIPGWCARRTAYATTSFQRNVRVQALDRGRRAAPTGAGKPLLHGPALSWEPMAVSGTGASY
jgi:hypothetical protein